MTYGKLMRVLEYLKKHKSGSKMELREATNYENIGDGIMKLRNMGYDIETTWGKTSTGARYAIYVLKSSQKVA